MNETSQKEFLELSWQELFPKTTSPDARRQRWEKWKKAAITLDPEQGQRGVEYWQRHECGPCDQVDGDWCKLQGLPCTVNPILTFNYGYIGMACMGFYPSALRERLESQVKRLIAAGLRLSGNGRQKCFAKAEQIWDGPLMTQHNYWCV